MAQVRINASGCDRPVLRDVVNHVVPSAANKWYDLGLQLLDPKYENELAIIEAADMKNDTKTCCRRMFSKWLDTDRSASWDRVIEALVMVGLDSLAINLQGMLVQGLQSDVSSSADVSTDNPAAELLCGEMDNRTDNEDKVTLQSNTEHDKSSVDNSSSADISTDKLATAPTSATVDNRISDQDNMLLESKNENHEDHNKSSGTALDTRTGVEDKMMIQSKNENNNEHDTSSGITPALQVMKIQEKKYSTIEGIEAEFGIMVIDVLQAFKSDDVNIRHLLIKLRSASAVRDRDIPLFGAGVFDKVTSIDKLFEILSEYWHLFDYDVLEFLVDTSQCEAAKIRYSKFLDSIDLAVIGNSQLVLKCNMFKSENPMEGTCKLRVKIFRDTISAEDEREVKKSIANNLHLEKYSLVLKSIKKGCIEITYQISPSTKTYVQNRYDESMAFSMFGLTPLMPPLIPGYEYPRMKFGRLRLTIGYDIYHSAQCLYTVNDDYELPTQEPGSRDIFYPSHDSPSRLLRWQAVSFGVQKRPVVYIDHAMENEKFIVYLRDILQSHLGYHQSDILTLSKDAIPKVGTPRKIITLLEKSQKVIIIVSKNYIASSHWTLLKLLLNKKIALTDIIPIISDDGSSIKDLPDELSTLMPLSYDDARFIEQLDKCLS